MTKICGHCGESFPRTYHDDQKWLVARFCSRSCATSARKGGAVYDSPAPPRECQQCGRTFEKPVTCSRADWAAARFCGRACAAESRRGKTPHNKGKVGPKWTAERRRKLAERVALNATTVRTTKWSGGTWIRIRRLALERDNFTCQDCGLRDPEIMTADHQIPRALAPERMYDLTNVVSRCPNCHARKTIRDKALIKAARAAAV